MSPLSLSLYSPLFPATPSLPLFILSLDLNPFSFGSKAAGRTYE